MKFTRARIVSFAAAAAFLAGCGSATDDITFSPPDGWKPTASVMSFMTMYQSPDTKQMIMLMKLPFQTNDMNSAMKQGAAKNATVTQSAAIKICGNQDAMMASGTGDLQTANEAKDSAQNKDTRKDKDRLDMVMTSTKGATYMAMYVRPIDMAADKSAEGAIRNLCPRT